MARDPASLRSRVARSWTVKPSDSLHGYIFLILTATHVLTHVFTRVHTTLFPVLQDEFNLSLQQLAPIAAIPPLCQTLLAIPAGLLSDKIGARRLILASLLVSAVGAFLASRAAGPLPLIIAVSLVYVNTTLYHAPAYSFLTKLFKPRDRLRALGIHGAGGSLGVAIGPISISLIMGVFALGWRQVYLFWFIPFLLGILAMVPIKSEPSEDAPVEYEAGEANNTPATSLLSMSLIMLILFLSIRLVAQGMTMSFMALYLVGERGLSTSTASFYIGLNTLVGVIGAPLGGFLAARYGEKRWLVIVLTLATVCFSLAIVVPDNTFFVLLYMAYGFFTFLGMAATSALMAKLSPGKQRGLAYALFFFPSSLMGVVAPIIAAAIAESYGLTSILAVSAVTFFVGVAVLKFGVRVQAG